MKKLIIIVIVLLLILIVGMGIFMFYTFSPTPTKSVNDSEEDDTIIGYNTGSAFITSLKDSRRFIKADIVIEVEDKEDEKILTDFNYRVRDCILDILGDITEEDLKSDGLKDKLKTEIKNTLQNMLKIDSIKGIYFNEFVVQ